MTQHTPHQPDTYRQNYFFKPCILLEELHRRTQSQQTDEIQKFDLCMIVSIPHLETKLLHPLILEGRDQVLSVLNC